MSSVGGPIQIQQPIDLSLLGKEGLQQQAAQIKAANPDMEFTEDQIVGALQYLSDNGIALEQKYVDNLVAGEPVLTVAEQIEAGVGILKGMVEGNPWLAPNPFATFTDNYLELAAILSQIKQDEAMEASESILQMTALALEIAELIIDIGETEAIAHIVAGAMSIASGATALIGGGISMKMSKGQDAAFLQTRNMQVQGVGGAFTGIGQIVQGAMAIKKAALEAVKTMDENAMKIAERRLNAAGDAYKTADEMITQLLQNLQKVIDEAMKAHGFGKG